MGVVELILFCQQYRDKDMSKMDILMQRSTSLHFSPLASGKLRARSQYLSIDFSITPTIQGWTRGLVDGNLLMKSSILNNYIILRDFFLNTYIGAAKGC